MAVKSLQSPRIEISMTVSCQPVQECGQKAPDADTTRALALQTIISTIAAAVKEKPDLAILIPCPNEETSIGKVVRRHDLPVAIPGNAPGGAAPQAVRR